MGARRRVYRRSAALKGAARAASAGTLATPHAATAAATGTVQATGTITAVTPPVVTGAEIGARIQASGTFTFSAVPVPWMQADLAQVDFTVPVVRWQQDVLQEDIRQ